MSYGANASGLTSLVFACSRAFFTSLFLILPVSVSAATQADSASTIAVKVESPSQALVAGAATQFVVRVHNSGAAGDSGNRLSVPIPTGLSNLTWTCSATIGSQCSSVSGSGTLNEPLRSLGSDSTLAYVFKADVDDSAPPFVELSAATALVGAARCASAETAPCRSSVSLPTGPGIMLDIRSQSAARNPGEHVRYTISAHTVSTLADSAGTVLRSPVPRGLINFSWRCESTVGACSESSGQGPIDQVLENFSRGSVSFVVSANVAPNAPATIVQSAVAVPPYGGSCVMADGGSMRSQSSPCTARRTLATSASLLISRSEDYRADASSITTRFVLENTGASANGSVVDAALADGVTRLDWTCVGEGATCPQANGSGAIQQTIASWPTSGRLVYDLVSVVASSSTSRATNNVRVTPSARGICAAGGSEGTCDARYAMTPAHAGLKLSQRVDDLGASARDVVTYRIDVGNAASAETAQNVVLHVPLPEGIQRFESWTCHASSASSTDCPALSGSGAIRETFAQLGPSSDLNFVIKARVASHPPAVISSRATLTAPASANLGCGITDSRGHACVASTQFSTVPVLALDQSMSATSLEPGSMVDYILDVFNLGATADRVNVRNFLPRGISNVSWACSGLGMGCPAANGNGDITAKLNQMPSGSGVQFHVTAQVDNTQPESATSVLAATPGQGGRCLNPLTGFADSASCVDRVFSSYVPKLELSQSADEQQLLRGGVVHHALILKNIGGPALDTRLVLPLANGIQRSRWTCSGFGGAVCPQVSGSGAIDARVASLPFNAFLQYSIRSVLSNDAPSSISTIATTTPGAKAKCADEGCTSSLSLPVTDIPSANLKVAVDASSKIAHPGASISWNVDVRNLGSERSGLFSLSSVMTGSGISIDDWTCVGSECPAPAGTGPINQVIASLSVYQPKRGDENHAIGRLQFLVNGRVAQHTVNGVEFAVQVDPAAGDTCAPASCVAHSVLPDQPFGGAEVSLILQTDETQVFPDSSFTYLFVVSNSGGQPIQTLPVTTTNPVGVVSSSWTCTSGFGGACPSGGAGVGSINEMILNLPVNAFVEFTIVATTDTTIPSQLELLADASPEPGVMCDPTSCMSSLFLPSGQEEMDLSLFVDTSSVAPNSTITYTYVVTNAGGGGISFPTIQAMDSAAFTDSSWTCSDVGGGPAMCGALSGTGPLATTAEFIGAGGALVYEITATVGSTLPPSIDYQIQLFPASQPPPLNCVPASCAVALSLPTGTPTVELTLNADVGVVEPDSAITYTFEVTNPGSVSVSNVEVTGLDSPAFASSSWTCTSTSGEGCSLSGIGPLNDFLLLEAGDTATYTITATVGTALPSSIDYQVQLDAPQALDCVPASCQIALFLPTGPMTEPTVTLALDADVASAFPGGTVNYSFTVNNPGPDDVFNVAVAGNDAADFVASSWTCAGTGTTCTASGTGPLTDFIAFLPSNTSVTYTVTALLGSTLSSTVDYSAGVSIGESDTPFVCIPASCVVSVSLPSGTAPQAAISVTKTADRNVLTPGGSVVYTVQFANAGSVDATSVRLVDNIPNGLTSFTWTCAASGAISCEQTSGSGPLDEFFVQVSPGASVTYTVSADVSTSASGSVLNRALVSGDNIQCNPSNCQAVSSLTVTPFADIVVSKSVSPPPGSSVSPGEPIQWTVRVINSGGSTTTTLSLRDNLPSSVSGISVSPTPGVNCDNLSPVPGSNLTCTIAPGFTGQASVTINATIAPDATNAVVNSVTAIGISDINCDNCSVSNPVGQAIDLALMNPRPFNAGGVVGTLIDVVNLSPTSSSMSQLSVSPAASLRLLSPFASGCTATSSETGDVVVSCPSPADAQGIQCSGAICTLGQLAQGGASTVFVALNGSSAATVQISAPGDSNISNNSIELPVGGTP